MQRQQVSEMDDILLCHTCKQHSEPATVAHFDFVWSSDASADFSMTGEDLIFDALLHMYLTQGRMLLSAGIMMTPIPQPELRIPIFVST